MHTLYTIPALSHTQPHARPPLLTPTSHTHQHKPPQLPTYTQAQRTEEELSLDKPAIQHKLDSLNSAQAQIEGQQRGVQTRMDDARQALVVCQDAYKRVCMLWSVCVW